MIETDTLTYTVSEIDGNPANLTVNHPVKFAVEDTKLFLTDERGKEHRTKIVKKAMRQPSEPPKIEPEPAKAGPDILSWLTRCIGLHNGLCLNECYFGSDNQPIVFIEIPIK